ncbi:MAG: tetratricopeptide repeat protein [Pseudomonadota bacterium]
MKLKLMIAAAATALVAETASAQVFVIGNGLGGECFQKTKSGFSNFRAVEEICTRALREQAMTRKNRAATYVNRGVLRMREGQYDKALADYAEAVSLQPELGAAYLNEGAAHIYRRDFAAALSPLDRAIELESHDLFAAYYNRAIAKENTGDVAGAYTDFQKSLELKPGWDLAERQLSRFSFEPVG